MRLLGDGGTDRREVLHDAYRYISARTDLVPFGGRYTQENSQIRHFGSKFWPFDREYLENCKSQRHMSIRA